MGKIEFLEWRLLEIVADFNMTLLRDRAASCRNILNIVLDPYPVGSGPFWSDPDPRLQS
jgi:hypothetical protein